jgi:peroxiredoxin
MKRYAPYGLVVLILAIVAGVALFLANRNNPAPAANNSASMNNPPGVMVPPTPTPGVFMATTFDKSETVALSNLRGKVVFLSSWKVTCGECTEALPGLEDLWQNYKDKGLVVISVNLDAPADREKVQAAITTAGLTMPVWSDPKNGFESAYQTGTLPGAVLIAKNGLVALTWTELLDFMRHDVLWAIDQTLQY